MQPDHMLQFQKVNQISFRVIKPITINPMKASKYCTTFQIHEQKLSFQGIATCNVTNFGGFSYTYKLLDEYKSRSIAYQPDVYYILLNPHK